MAEEQSQGEIRMDRFFGKKIVEAGWVICRMHLDQDVSYYAHGVVGLWECEIDMKPCRPFWQSPKVVRGRGVTAAQAIENAYNLASRSGRESLSWPD